MSTLPDYSSDTTDPDRSSPIKPGDILIGVGVGYTNFGHTVLEVLAQMPLPGIVIFVHGVNSEGEWYTEAENGLCKGLNERLKRKNEHLAYTGVEAGQLHPVQYMPGLTDDGFLNPDLQADTFIASVEHFSPVIHFRWCYKAVGEELQRYGDALFLNEENYWGGGPFANGCSALPDLWQKGLSDELFLWLHIQHLNPVHDRNVYSCPPRTYQVLAALRLARLIESIRKKQADVPVTIVCHSQGNMVGMAAAFLGDRLPELTDVTGKKGRCVADNYVLCNPPFSLVKSNGTESWIQGQVADKNGKVGRQSEAARVKTLAAFFDIVRKQGTQRQTDETIDEFMANEAHGFNARNDRARYGYGLKPSTCGRVTLYCNPHDQVISASTVQGIGWRGMSQQEIEATGGVGTFCQRVFAQDFKVGQRGKYDYWDNHWRKPKRGSHAFWYPESQQACYDLGKGLEASKGGFGRVMSVLSYPIMKLAMSLMGTRINALPPKDWSIPLTAPDLLPGFEPMALRFGAKSMQFDQAYEMPGEARSKALVRKEGDPYTGDRVVPKKDREGPLDKTTDAAEGDRDSEAALRYEDHAMLRMQAKRERLYKNDAYVTEEDKPEDARRAYKAWRSEKIKENLAANLDTHATDHSTIMSNGDHAEKALAYDVAVGCCNIWPTDLQKLRIAADCRLLKGLADDDSNKVFEEYFKYGKLKGNSTYEWVRKDGDIGIDGRMPVKIIDEREFSPTYGENNPWAH